MSKKKKNELVYITSERCGWCKKADPIVEELRNEGYLIKSLDITNEDQAKEANKIKQTFNVSCGTPLFIDTEDGNMVCGFKEKDILKKWADGEKIPAPPPRQPQPQQQQQQQQRQPNINAQEFMMKNVEFRFSVWQEAKQSLMEKFHNDFEVWNNWQFKDSQVIGDCPLKKRPTAPTTDAIRKEAEKIMSFCRSNH